MAYQRLLSPRRIAQIEAELAGGCDAMTKRHIRKLRANAIVAQDNKCIICGEDMLPPEAYPHPLAATAEHLVPKADGGPTNGQNIGASHNRCNQKRGTGRVPPSRGAA